MLIALAIIAAIVIYSQIPCGTAKGGKPVTYYIVGKD